MLHVVLRLLLVFAAGAQCVVRLPAQLQSFRNGLDTAEKAEFDAMNKSALVALKYLGSKQRQDTWDARRTPVFPTLIKQCLATLKAKQKVRRVEQKVLRVERELTAQQEKNRAMGISDEDQIDEESCLHRLRQWVKSCIVEKTDPPELPRDDPLYWKLDKPLTEGQFPSGMVRYVGLSGSGKTRRLLEVLYARPCILATSSLNGNGGNNGIEITARKITSSVWVHNREVQKYFWTALACAWKRFYVQRIASEADGRKRVAWWMKGSSCIEKWMEELPPPPPIKDMVTAIALLSSQVDVSVLLDEIQAVSCHVLPSLLSACRHQFKNIVITGTGVSEPEVRAAWSNSPSMAKHGPRPYKTVRGPSLLSEAEVEAYFDEFAPGLAHEVLHSDEVGQWFKDGCRARVAARAAFLFRRCKRKEDVVDAISEGFSELSNPDCVQGWLAKNHIRQNANRLLGPHTLHYLLARAFLGYTWWDKAQTQPERKKQRADAYTMMEIGVAPLNCNGHRLREFLAFECLRRNNEVMDMVPLIIREDWERSQMQSAQSKGAPFEKYIAHQLFSRTKNADGLGKMKLYTDLTEMLADWKNSPNVQRVHWPDWRLGPDILGLLDGELYVVQAKCHAKLPSGKKLQHACNTTKLATNAFFSVKKQRVLPKSKEREAAQIREAVLRATAEGLKVVRVLALKAHTAEQDEKDRLRVAKVDGSIKVWHLSPENESDMDDEDRKEAEVETTDEDENDWGFESMDAEGPNSEEEAETTDED
eukprot:CAMPEP_0196758320 /NCGR_PEP_ID=MMETSP1091-20130531/104125_1 /TAXON_ID=302021 /ORGANISM="Rhodomonas sp., Strain CCMP768" /LENGTH=759 /DNA_ID=CAMNT_0042107139 /DNA_START=116 /DNA_END=2395 /DNA_ORIENTATION=-